MKPQVQQKITKEDKDMMEAIELLGQYMTHREFCVKHPELEVNRKHWYDICKGNTMQYQRTQLRKQYEREFEEEWEDRKYFAYQKFLRSAKLFLQQTDRRHNQG